MLIGQRLLMGGGNKAEVETIIPSTQTSRLPVEFGTLFFATHNRHPKPNELVVFRLPAGNYPGIPHGSKVLLSRAATWALGTWPGARPTQMKIIIDGNQYSAGGCGLRSDGFSSRIHCKYYSDGGNVMDFANTADFINSTTPLILEGAGGLFSGGGGGASVSAQTQSTQLTSEGRPGAGFPWTIAPTAQYSADINFPPSSSVYSLKDIGDAGIVHQVYGAGGFPSGTATTGNGGGMGKLGGSASTTGNVGSGGPGADKGEPGVVFFYANNSDSRFQNASSVFSMIDFSGFTGVINNIPASTWRNNLPVMAAASMFGYIDPAVAYRHYFQGVLLNTIVATGRT